VSTQAYIKRKEKNTSLCFGRKKELKRKKKTTPSIQNYKQPKQTKKKNPPLLEKLSSKRAFSNVRGEKGRDWFFFILRENSDVF